MPYADPVKHREYKRLWQAQFRLKNPEYIKAIADKGKPNKNKRQREYYQERKTQAFAILGGPVCKRCSFVDSRALQIDHIHGGGSAERGCIVAGKPQSSNLKVIKEILKDTAAAILKYQILCANCNWIKRHENNE